MHTQCEYASGGGGLSVDESGILVWPPRRDRAPQPLDDGWPRWCRHLFDRARARPRAVAQPPVRPLSIAMVALSGANEAQLRAACRDVAAMGLGYTVALAQWNGQCADVVIADCDDVYGRLVCTLAVRSRSRIVWLRVGSQVAMHRGADGVFRSLSHADLTALIAGLCAETLARDRTGGTPDVAASGVDLFGLPRTCLLSQVIQQSADGWMSLACGRNRIRIHRMSSRIQATSPRHLEEAGRQLLGPGWRAASNRPLDPSRAETSLDLFLLQACLQQQAILPRLDAAHFRLAHWPDLGGKEPLHAWVLPLMAAVVRQAPVSVPELSGPKALPSGQVNALFWAFRASGALEPVAMPRRHQPS